MKIILVVKIHGRGIVGPKDLIIKRPAVEVDDGGVIAQR